LDWSQLAQERKDVIGGWIELTGRRGRRRKQLVDDDKETRVCWKQKVKTLDCTVWRTRYGRVYGLVVRQATMTTTTTENVVTCFYGMTVSKDRIFGVV
jgi:hypothetical protein